MTGLPPPPQKEPLQLTAHDLPANATSLKSRRRCSREVNSIGRRQLSSGFPTPLEHEHQAQITAALHNLFTSLQQRPFWKAGGRNMHTKCLITLIFRKHHSSHTSGTSQNSAGRYDQKSTSQHFSKLYWFHGIWQLVFSCTSGCQPYFQMI